MLLLIRSSKLHRTNISSLLTKVTTESMSAIINALRPLLRIGKRDPRLVNSL